MKKNNLSGLSPLWLISLALLLGVFLTTTIPLVISSNAINSTAWIGFSGNVVGGAVALIAVVVASMNVARQLRVNLMSREEDRMEQDLPGLREAATYLIQIRRALHGKTPIRMRSVVNSFNSISAHDRLEDAIRKRIPTVPRRVQDVVVARITAIDHLTFSLSRIGKKLAEATSRLEFEKEAGLDATEIRGHAAELQAEFNVEQELLDIQLERLDATTAAVLDEIRRFERLLAAFRPQIERYFKE
jgi:hypothetical protein